MTSSCGVNVIQKCFLIWLLLVLMANESLEDVMMEMIQKQGYAAEQHFVTTEDGYILGLYRIPPKNDCREPNKTLLLMHGMFDASLTYVLFGNPKSSGFFFADRGYDVWLGNARGNTLSRNHTNLSAESLEFWNFSWNEIGIYDLPAMIDYILSKTEQNDLSFVGYSQGSTAAMVMLSSKPKYNKKIRILHAISPPIFFKYTHPLYSSVLKKLINLTFIENLLIFSRLWEMVPYMGLYKIFGSICSVPFTTNICDLFRVAVFGPSYREYTGEMLSDILNCLPAGSGYKQLLHYLQLTFTGQFSNYDHGNDRNIQIYGQSSPPSYQLSKIETKVHIMYGTSDWMVMAENIPLLVHQLPLSNVCVSKHDGLNHLDFFYTKNVEVVNRNILEIDVQ